MNPSDHELELRLQRAVERLHQRGPRVLYEMLAELGRERLIMTLIEARVGSFAELDPKALVEGDQIPPPRLRIVP